MLCNRLPIIYVASFFRSTTIGLWAKSLMIGYEIEYFSFLIIAVLFSAGNAKKNVFTVFTVPIVTIDAIIYTRTGPETLSLSMIYMYLIVSVPKTIWCYLQGQSLPGFDLDFYRWSLNLCWVLLKNLSMNLSSFSFFIIAVLFSAGNAKKNVFTVFIDPIVTIDVCNLFPPSYLECYFWVSGLTLMGVLILLIQILNRANELDLWIIFRILLTGVLVSSPSIATIEGTMKIAETFFFWHLRLT